MHPEILSKEQTELLPLIEVFKRQFFLVGGTAIALQIGHRRSIDFDLFTQKQINPKNIIEKIQAKGFTYLVTRNVSEQLNLIINGVKFTFFQFPFEIEHPLSFEKIIKMPDLLTLAAMKAYALGRRSKWKDYYDLYFLLNNGFSLKQIEEKATEIFGQLFSPKLFRAQLSWFDDIDYSETIDFIGVQTKKSTVQTFLSDTALNLE